MYRIIAYVNDGNRETGAYHDLYLTSNNQWAADEKLAKIFLEKKEADAYLILKASKPDPAYAYDTSVVEQANFSATMDRHQLKSALIVFQTLLTRDFPIHRISQAAKDYMKGLGVKPNQLLQVMAVLAPLLKEEK